MKICEKCRVDKLGIIVYSKIFCGKHYGFHRKAPAHGTSIQKTTACWAVAFPLFDGNAAHGDVGIVVSLGHIGGVRIGKGNGVAHLDIFAAL